MRAKQIILLLLTLCCLRGSAVDVYSRKITTEHGLPDNNIRDLAQDSTGYLWLGTTSGLIRYDGYFFTSTPCGETERRAFFDAYRPTTVAPRARTAAAPLMTEGRTLLADNRGNGAVIDETGRLWFIDRQTGEVIEMRVFDEAMMPLVSSKKYIVLTSADNQLVWVSTNGCGLTLFDRRTATEQHIREGSGLIQTNYLVAACMDNHDNVWVADEFHGLACLSTASTGAQLLRLNEQHRSSHANQVSALRPLPDGRLLIANTVGDIYVADASLQPPFTLLRSGEDIHAICPDPAGGLWIGSRMHGLTAPDGRRYVHDPADTASLASDHVYDILCDSRGRTWVACENASLDLVQHNPDGTLSFRHFLPGSSPRVLLEDRSGNIWAGTQTSLLYSTTSLPDTLRAPVSCLYEDGHGRIWVGTLGAGVGLLSKDKEHGPQECSLPPLLSQEVQSIIEDSRGHIWVATRQGLTSFDPATGSYRHHYDSHNLAANYYTAGCAVRLADGRLAFGTNAGIVVIAPPVPSVATKSQLPDSLQLTVTDLTMDGRNTFTARFSTFDYEALATTRYACMLEGYDSGWSEPSPYSFVTYRRLPAGHYVLHIRAYAGDSAHYAELALPIDIQPQWWATWWAHLLWTLLALLLAYVVYRQLRTVYLLRQRISVEKQLTEYKLRFFTNISHEFRTPLTIIQGAMQRIRAVSDRDGLPADLRQPVSSMGRSVGRMSRLIDQLLEFRKMQNNKLRLALEETEVVAFVRDIFQSFADIAENKHIAYTFVPQERKQTLFIDRSHVDKILYNLLSNAFKYTPEHGAVTLRVGQQEGAFVIRVEDTGVGIPKEQQAELFSRFMQSAFSRDSVGIGLNLTKELVAVHHGSIRYEENHPQGSVFIVELPLDKSVYAETEFLSPIPHSSFFIHHSSFPILHSPFDATYRELAPRPMNDRRVLVVEDDSDIVDFLRGALQRYFAVGVAMDGVEALSQMSQQRPDLIISDISMPVMDGIELTRHVRSDEALRDIPIILLTAHTADAQRLQATQQGADAYITKPFDLQLLITTAAGLLQQRDMLRQHYGQQTADAPRAALPEIIVEERDRRFLDTLNIWLGEHLSNSQLSVDDVAAAMNLRRTVFFQKVKALTGQTPADYIKHLRMERAAKLLASQTLTVAEVCYKVGISDPHYFARLFRQHFGVSPRKFQQG